MKMEMGKYGDLPIELGLFKVNCKEMMFYQYLPIKMPNGITIYENRLSCFNEIVAAVREDFIRVFGMEEYIKSYIYLTAKYMYQSENCSYNRMGYHSDGFLTSDINYIWCDKNPTIFNSSDFSGMPKDDNSSLLFMNSIASVDNEVKYNENTLLRLNQFNIHKVAEKQNPCMRTFLKLSFSKDKYDLIGNSRNYLMDYNWDMKERKQERNIPQSSIGINQ